MNMHGYGAPWGVKAGLTDILNHFPFMLMDSVRALLRFKYIWTINPHVVAAVLGLTLDGT